MANAIQTYIRCRADAKYGWGHASRTLQLTKHIETAETDLNVTVGIDGSEAAASYFVRNGITNIRLFNGDGRDERKLLDEINPEVAVIDLLDIEAAYVEQLSSRGTRTLLYDDLATGYPFGDALLRPQTYEGASDLAAAATPTQHLYAGPAYFVVSDSLVALRRDPKGTPPHARSLFVCLGGTPRRDRIEWLAETLAALPTSGMKIRVLMGFQADVDIDDARRKFGDRVEVLPGTDGLENAVGDADIALSASGLVKFELASMGIPMALIAVVDHQRDVGRRFANATGAAEYLGHFADIAPAAAADALVKLADDRAARLGMAAKGLALVDGAASRRIADVLRDLASRH